MASGDFKDLVIRTASNKISNDKASNNAKNPKYDGYKRNLASMVFKFFDKNKLLEAVLNMRLCQTSN